MINSKTLFRQLQKRISLHENEEEIKSILFLLFEKEFGLTRTEILAEKELATIDDKRIKTIIQRINQQEPIQYILEEAEFMGRRFRVNPSVLIPRPETEMIVRLAKAEKLDAPSILDIGTGSGCIAISLALELPEVQVHALDISGKALLVASENARALGATVQFVHSDILSHTPNLSRLAMIVSNPPYVMEKEKNTMNKNVVEYEPSMALFVPNENPLLFYEAIAKKGKSLLRVNGIILVEINEQLGIQTKSLFNRYGYDTTIVKDMDGKDRVIRAVLH